MVIFNKKWCNLSILNSMTIRLIYMHLLEPFYLCQMPTRGHLGPNLDFQVNCAISPLCYIKNSSGVTWGHRIQKAIFTKKASSPTECVALMRDSCICISLTPTTKVVTLKNCPGSFGVTGVKRSFSLKMLQLVTFK